MISIGVVIPNYNGGQYLAEAIESVLRQKNAKVQCIVVDGDSTDNSVEIANRYSDKIKIISEKDDGQSSAIQKGFDLLNCDLLGWLNSDDRLTPNALEEIVKAEKERPDVGLFHGDCELIDEYGRFFGLMEATELDYESLRIAVGKIIQPGSFYRREMLKKIGGLRSKYFGLMDVDLWIRLLKVAPAHRIYSRLAQFRIHSVAKSSQPPWLYYRESMMIAFEHNKDQIVRGLLSRARAIPRHFLVWSLKLNVNHYVPAPAPSNPIKIYDILPKGISIPTSTQAQIQWENCFQESDVVIRHARNMRGLNKTFKGRKRAAEPQQIVVLTEDEDENALKQFPDILNTCSFFLFSNHFASSMEKLRVPSFRSGKLGCEEDWQKALYICQGQA